MLCKLDERKSINSISCTSSITPSITSTSTTTTTTSSSSRSSSSSSFFCVVIVITIVAVVIVIVILEVGVIEVVVVDAELVVVADIVLAVVAAAIRKNSRIHYIRYHYDSFKCYVCVCVCVCVCLCVCVCVRMRSCVLMCLLVCIYAYMRHKGIYVCMSVCLLVSHNKTVCQLRCPMCTGKMCTYIISLIQIFFFQIAIKYDNNEIIFASRGCVVNATCLSDGVEQCTDTGPSQVILVE